MLRLRAVDGDVPRCRAASGEAAAAAVIAALEKELTAEFAKLGIVGEEAAAAVQVKFC